MKGKAIYILGCTCMVMIFLINSVASKGLAAEEFLPVVLYSVPGDMDTDVPISGVLRITFLLPMDPVTTLPSFHLYVAGDLETDLKGNGSLDLNGNILTFVFSGLDYGEYYEVIIDSSATDLEGNSLDGNYDQENGQGDLDNWWMRFETVEEPIQPPPPVAGYTSIFRSGEMISSLAVDSEDYLWAGTQAEGNDEGEIWYFTGRTWVKKTPSLNSQLSINNITCMLSAQDQMWVVFDISGESDPNLPKVGVFKNDNWQIISAEELNISHEEIINDISIDSLGQVWLATGASGVLKYYDNQVTQYTIQDNLPDNQIISIAVDNQDNVWAAMPLSGISQLPAGNNTWISGYEYQIYERLLGSADYVSDFAITGMDIDSDGNIWVATSNGLLRLEGGSSVPGSWERYTAENGLPDNMINRLTVNKGSNTIWIGTSKGLGRFNPQNNPPGTPYTTEDKASELSVKTITALALNSRGEIWFGTDEGLQMWDDVKPTVVVSASFPSQNDTVDVSTDIRLVFSEPMDPNVTEDAFTMTSMGDNAEIISGIFSWSNPKTMLFKPDSLSQNKSYIVSLDISAKDLAGNILLSPYNIVFNTGEQPEEDITPPYIAPNKSCSMNKLTFYIKDDGVGVNLASIIVKLNGEVINVEPTGNSKSYQITYTPQAPFAENEQITVSVTAEDLAGNSLSPENGEFTLTPINKLKFDGSGCFIGTINKKTNFLKNQILSWAGRFWRF